MSYEITKKAIKISFIQALPGEELSVVDQLIKACSKCGIDEDEYVITKGFGSFDIVIMYAAKSFDEHLTTYGPIKGVLRTSRSFCFHYGAGKLLDFFTNLKKCAFSAISLVKYQQVNQQDVVETELDLINKLSVVGKEVNSYVFGTLGWSELIVIYCSEDLNELTSKVFWAIDDIVGTKICKTYSFICLNHSIILKEGLVKGLPSLKENISNRITPSIKITCIPKYSNEIVNHWFSHKRYTTQNLIGKEDILVTPVNSDCVSWECFLNDLLQFRKTFSHKIHSTQTIMCQFVEGQDPPETEDHGAVRSRELSYDYDVLKAAFDEKSATNIASNLNNLKGLLSCNIIGDAFVDMRKYIDYILLVGETDSNHKRRINFAWQVTDYIKSGAELRILGTHGTLEESSGQFIKIRGGVHRSICALELFPDRVISRLIRDENWTWKGFVCAGGKNFNQIHDVLVIPDDVLWKPGTWWAIYHEIAHQLINRFGTDFSRSTQEIKVFLSNKKAEDKWFTLIVELAAELIGYELGFFGDYDLFFEKIWGYIYDLSYKRGEPKSISSYVVRTYFVELMSVYLLNDDHSLFDKENTFNGLIKHMEKIEFFFNNKLGKKISFDDKYFDAANYCMIFKELLPWIDNRLKPLIDNTQLRSDKGWLQDQSVQDAFSSIVTGAPFYSRVNYPDALLYRLTKHDEMQFNSEIATILTFWHQTRIYNCEGI